MCLVVLFRDIIIIISKTGMELIKKTEDIPRLAPRTESASVHVSQGSSLLTTEAFALKRNKMNE